MKNSIQKSKKLLLFKFAFYMIIIVINGCSFIQLRSLLVFEDSKVVYERAKKWHPSYLLKSS